MELMNINFDNIIGTKYDKGKTYLDQVRGMDKTFDFDGVYEVYQRGDRVKVVKLHEEGYKVWSYMWTEYRYLVWFGEGNMFIYDKDNKQCVRKDIWNLPIDNSGETFGEFLETKYKTRGKLAIKAYTIDTFRIFDSMDWRLDSKEFVIEETKLRMVE